MFALSLYMFTTVAAGDLRQPNRLVPMEVEASPEFRGLPFANPNPYMFLFIFNGHCFTCKGAHPGGELGPLSTYVFQQEG